MSTRRRSTRKYAESAAKRLEKVEKKTRKLASIVGRPEFKNIDTYWSVSSLVNVWQGIGLTDIAQGDGVSQRDGLVIQGKNLSFNFAITNGAAVPVECRFMLVRDLSDGKGAAPTVTEILANSSTDVLAYREVVSDSASEYKVVWDRKFVLPAVGNDKSMRIIRHNRKLWNSKISFTGANTTDYKKGHYFLYAYCEHPTATDVHFALNARVYYIDN